MALDLFHWKAVGTLVVSPFQWALWYTGKHIDLRLIPEAKEYQPTWKVGLG